MPAPRDRPIGCQQNETHPGKLRQKPERPSPPKMARDENDGVGPAKLAAVFREQAQFGEQLAWRHRQVRLRARVLERGDPKSVSFQGRLQAASGGHAEGAVGIEENPAAAGPPPFAVGHF